LRYYAKENFVTAHTVDALKHIKGTVSPDYKCLEVMSIKSPLLGHVTPDTKKILKSSFNFYGPLNFFGIPIILFTGA
jgi:hypothetical protein